MAQLTATQEQYADDLLTRAQDVMTELKSVLEQETDALRAVDLVGALSLQDKKIQLMQRYEQIVQQAKNHEHVLKTATTPRKDEIRKLEKDFRVSTERNLSALKHGKKSLERLVDRMLNTIRDCIKEQEHVAYTASGTVDGRKGSMSINIDQTL